MPADQTPVTITIVAHNYLIYAVQLGDRVPVTDIFRTVSLRINSKTRNVRSVYHTFIDVIHSTNFDQSITMSSTQLLQSILEQAKNLVKQIEDLRNDNQIIKKENAQLKQDNTTLKQDNTILKQENLLLKQNNDQMIIKN
ncbi:unnamed protein product, partial [Rotaria sordida]